MSLLLHQFRPRLGPTRTQINIFGKTGRISSRSMSSVQKQSNEVKPPARADGKNKGPIKFTASSAYINYKSSDNFYGGDDRDLPKSHNFVLAGSGIFAFYYLIFMRDDIEADGGKKLFQPLHETVPELAIPMLEAAITENKKFGNNTQKLEKKLEELMKNPEKHGGGRRKLVEN